MRESKILKDVLYYVVYRLVYNYNNRHFDFLIRNLMSFEAILISIYAFFFLPKTIFVR